MDFALLLLLAWLAGCKNGSAETRPAPVESAAPVLDVTGGPAARGEPVRLMGAYGFICVERHEAETACVGDFLLPLAPVSTDGSALRDVRKGYSEHPIALKGFRPLDISVAGRVARCSLEAGGVVRCWDGGPPATPSPDGREVGRDVKSVSSEAQTCVVNSGGGVWCWGHELCMRPDGPLGYDEVAFSQVSGVADAAVVKVGLRMACALSEERSVHCWGDLDGGPPCTGQQARLIAGVENVLQLAVGDETACVLDHAGDVQCWGSNRCEGLARLRSELEFSREPVAIPVPTDVVELRGYGDGFIALGSHGDVWYWGCNLLEDRSEPTVKRVEGILPAIDIVVGADFGCALLADRNLHCFGPRIDGRPPGMPRPAFESKGAWVDAPLYEVRTPTEESHGQ